MKLEHYIKKLNSSKEYKDFIKSNKDAFVIYGVFNIDFEINQNMGQIDYYIPSTKKVAIFTLGNEVSIQLSERGIPNKKIEVLNPKSRIDLDELKGILQDEMKNRSITERINKIVAVIGMADGKAIWNINCILTGMELLMAHIEDNSKSVLKMEKISMADIMRRVPAEYLQQLKDKAKAEREKAAGKAGTSAKADAKAGNSKKAKIKEEIKKLDKIKEKIEEEEKNLKKKAEEEADGEGGDGDWEDEEPDEKEPEPDED